MPPAPDSPLSSTHTPQASCPTPSTSRPSRRTPRPRRAARSGGRRAPQVRRRCEGLAGIGRATGCLWFGRHHAITPLRLLAAALPLALARPRRCPLQMAPSRLSPRWAAPPPLLLSRQRELQGGRPSQPRTEPWRCSGARSSGCRWGTGTKVQGEGAWRSAAAWAVVLHSPARLSDLPPLLAPAAGAGPAAARRQPLHGRPRGAQPQPTAGVGVGKGLLPASSAAGCREQCDGVPVRLRQSRRSVFRTLPRRPDVRFSCVAFPATLPTAAQGGVGAAVRCRHPGAAAGAGSDCAAAGRGDCHQGAGGS